MRILVAPQDFKEALSGPAVAAAIEAGLRDVDPTLTIDCLPVADGGEGTVAALVAATSGQFRTVTATDPFGRPVRATWGWLADATAVVELAAASGLDRLHARERDPLRADTAGTGIVIRAALDAGARRIIIGLGGSATNDGGAGILRALGARLLDREGRDLPAGGAALIDLATVDLSNLDGRLLATELQIASDVDNPLVGPAGASAIYGPQKGATPAMIARLDVALSHWGTLLETATGQRIVDQPGAGAAGGAGAALLWLPKAEHRPGIDIILEAARFADRVRNVDLVITAEGRVDRTTARGKATHGVARAAGAKLVVVLCGSIGQGGEDLVPDPFAALLPIGDGPRSLAASRRASAALIRAAAARLLQIIRVGPLPLAARRAESGDVSAAWRG